MYQRFVFKWALFVVLSLVVIQNALADARVWKSKSGNHEITAELVSSDVESVTLLTEDGREINVPLSKLSSADQQYVASRTGDDGEDDDESRIERVVARFYQALSTDRDEIRALLTKDGQAGYDASPDGFQLEPADQGKQPRVEKVRIDQDKNTAVADYHVPIQSESRPMQMLFSAQENTWRVAGLVDIGVDGTKTTINFAEVIAKTEAIATSTNLTAAEIQSRGSAAFAKGMCAKCHGESGRGGKRGPNLTDVDWIHCDGSVAGIRQVLVSGIPKAKVSNRSFRFGMNPVTKLVDESELDALAEYVKAMGSSD